MRVREAVRRAGPSATADTRFIRSINVSSEGTFKKMSRTGFPSSSISYSIATSKCQLMSNLLS